MKEFYELKIIQAELALEGARYAGDYELFTKYENDIKNYAQMLKELSC